MDPRKITAREAEYTRYRDFDDTDRQRRQSERDRYQARKLKSQLRATFWGDK